MQNIFSTSNVAFITLSANSTVTFGSCSDTTNKYTSLGCSFIVPAMTNNGYLILQNSQSNSNLYLYSCDIHHASSKLLSVAYASRYWNCHFDYRVVIACQSYSNLYNCIFEKTGYLNVIGAATVNKVTMLNVDFYLGFAANGTVTNFYGRGATAYGWMDAGTNDVVNFVDCDLDLWSIYDLGSGWTYNRKYTYDLIVLNGEISEFVENANVTLSKDGVQIGTWLTNSSGQIDTQILTYGYYDEAHGNTLQEGDHPFVLTVTHPDWADYESRFYVTEKTKMTISMQDQTTSNNAAMIWSLLFGTLAFAAFLWWRRSH